MAKRRRKYGVSILSLLAVAVIVVAFAVANAPAQSYPAGMVSYWKFDEGSGNIAYDSVNENHGTIYGATWTPGQVNGALSFDGVNDYISVPDSASLDITNALTIEMFINKKGGTSAQFIMKSLDLSASNTRYGMQLYNSRFYIHILTTSGWKESSSPNTIPNNMWVHLVITYDGTNFRGYENGIRTINQTWSGNITTNNDPLIIGASVGASYPNFYGTIDEIAIYNRALTAEEILEHYNNGLQGLGYLEPDTIPPIISSTDPTDGAIDVSVYTPIKVTFSEIMDKTSVQNSFPISPSVSGDFSWDGNTTIFTPDVALEVSTTYTVTIETGAIDLAGNPLTSPYGFSFTTSATAPPPGMVSYWKFDEGSGTVIYDSANGNHGTTYGATWTPGQVNGALSFDGVDDYVKVLYDASLDITSEITIEAWVKPNKEAQYSYVAKSGWYDTYWFGSDAAEGGQMWFSVHTDGGDFRAVKSGYPSKDVWHHFVGTFDGRYVRLYENGVLEDIADAGSTVTINTNNNPVYIGYEDDFGIKFNGILDEVAIWGRALSAEEILEHYNNGLQGLGYGLIAPPVAVAEPELDENDVLVLDGSHSYDPDGMIVSWEWVLTNRDPEGNNFLLTGEIASTNGTDIGVYDVTLTVTDNDGLTDTDTMMLAVPAAAAKMPEDTKPPTGAVHAYRNMLWPPNNQDVEVEISGYLFDELSALIDGGGTGISLAYLVVDRETIGLPLGADGSFSVKVKFKAKEGATYTIKLFATDTSGNGPALIDSTDIIVPESRAKGSSGRN